jgi:hypothetical protein
MQERKIHAVAVSEPHQRPFSPSQQSWNYGEKEMKSDLFLDLKRLSSPPHRIKKLHLETLITPLLHDQSYNSVQINNNSKYSRYE